MATKLKRAAETVAAPRDMTEANQFLARLGAIGRDRQVLQAALDESVAAAKKAAEASAAPLVAEEERLTRGLQMWAEANRASLTNEGRTKTVKLPAGEVSWRARPPSVRITGVAAVIRALTIAGLERMLRVKTEVDKEAILKEPGAVVCVPGISVGSEGEEFVVSPAGMALSGSAAA